MITFAEFMDRGAPSAFLLIAAGLLAWPRDGRGVRAAWIALLAAGLAYGLTLNLNPLNFPQANFSHY